MGTMTVFSYDGFDKDTRGKLVALAGQIKRGKAEYVRAVLLIGGAIHEAHELLAGVGREGKFQDWLERECGIERRTAYNYLHAFDAFGKCETVSHFSAGAMYALSAPTAPPKARDEAIKRSENGEKITKSVADEIIESLTVEAEPTRAAGTGLENQRLVPGSPDDGPPRGSTPAPAPVDTPSAPPSAGGGETEGATTDYGQCPNCAGTKWTKGESGVTCAKCRHPHGEATGGADEDRVATQRAKTVKTAEALMRAFDDLNLLAAKPKEHANAIVTCKILRKEAGAWK